MEKDYTHIWQQINITTNAKTFIISSMFIHIKWKVSLKDPSKVGAYNEVKKVRAIFVEKRARFFLFL